MHRPDTIIEIHRERVQDQTVEMFSGDKYTQSVDGTGYSATATLDLTLDRVWFILDSHQRLWQEETDGESRDPLRHFAIDLVIFDSKIVIDSVTCIPLVPLPPATITIPDGPRAGESREIPYNEIPLFGRLTIHDQLEPHQTEPGKQTHRTELHRAGCSRAGRPLPLRDEYAARLFGPHIERRSDGDTAFTGQDPRISWELDYAEAYWITHSIAGELMVNLEKLQHPSLSDDEARIRVLDSLAAQIADAVRPKLAEMGDDTGIVNLLPSPMDVDPEAQDDSTVKALDAIVQRFESAPSARATHESMVVQLQTLRALPSGEELPASILAENPHEKTGLAVTGWSILRQVRDTVMNSFGLDESDFDADAPCLLEGPKTINIGGQDRSLDALDADIVPRTQDGRLVVDGTVSAETTLYDFKATFKVTYEMGLDDIPRDPTGRRQTSDPAGRPGNHRESRAGAEPGRRQEARRRAQRPGLRGRSQASQRAVRRTSADGGCAAGAESPGAGGESGLQPDGGRQGRRGCRRRGCRRSACAAGDLGSWGCRSGGAGAGGLLTLAIAQYSHHRADDRLVRRRNRVASGQEIAERPSRGHIAASDRNTGRRGPQPPAPRGVLPSAAGETVGRLRHRRGGKRGRRPGTSATFGFVGGRWPTDGHPWKLSDDDADVVRRFRRTAAARGTGQRRRQRVADRCCHRSGRPAPPAGGGR